MLTQVCRSPAKITGQPSQAVKQVDRHQPQLEIVVGLLRITMELIIVQEVHYSYGTLACMVHILKWGIGEARSHDHGMTGQMINKCSLYR